MAVQVGLMGFGRIGRNLFRILYKHDDIQIVAISDIADHKGLESSDIPRARRGGCLSFQR